MKLRSFGIRWKPKRLFQRKRRFRVGGWTTRLKNIRQNGSWNPRYLGVKIKNTYSSLSLYSSPCRACSMVWISIFEAFVEVATAAISFIERAHTIVLCRSKEWEISDFFVWWKVQHRSLTYLLWNGKNGWKFQNAVFKVWLSVFHVGFLHSTALICYPFYWITTKTRLQAQKL